MAEARRKTSIEERKEIIEFCIKHNRNYKETASIYDVSYSQVYPWVKKYDTYGEESLTDKRGRHKSDDEVDELERLRRENIRLKRQLEEKDMLAELIKEYDERFNHILGYRRMTSWLNHFNHTNYSKNRVHRIIKKLGIHSVIRRKKEKYSSSTPEAVAENKLGRDFYAATPNEKWATDMTEFKIPNKKRSYI